jgi:hypothetical protein
MVRSIAALLGACMLGAGLFAGDALADSQVPLMTGAITGGGGVTTVAAHGSFTAAHGELNVVRAFHATVTCLEVNGNDGIATAVIDSAQNPSFTVGETVVSEGYDTDALLPKDATPGTATDLWRNSFPGGIYPDYAHPGCYLPFFAPVPIDRGDILVMPGS